VVHNVVECSIAGDGEWTFVGDSGDPVAYFSAVNVLDEKLVVFGGTYRGLNGVAYSNQLKEFTFADETWKQLQWEERYPLLARSTLQSSYLAVRPWSSSAGLMGWEGH